MFHALCTMVKPLYITGEGLEKLKEELQQLKTERRQEIAKRIKEAKEMGDLSENAEYSEAREEQAANESKIVELEELIKNANIIKAPSKERGVVGIGSTVIAIFNGTEREFTIVGSEEARPSEGKISNESPLGSSFLGKLKGETVEVSTPKGKIKYKIKDIK